MTPNYFRIAQEDARAPKASRVNWYVVWALAFSPAAAMPRKTDGSGPDLLPPPKAKR
jgi:hypothetical protein